MYLENGRGFFEGVCAPCKMTAYFHDPPPRFANRVPPAPVAAKANGADDNAVRSIGHLKGVST